ncbi:unnamed protein product, partial [Laminaria digitata]
LDDYWARATQEQVFFRTDPDAFRPAGKLPDLSPAGRERRRQFNAEMLERLDGIDTGALTGQDAISARLFRYERETESASYGYQDHMFPITSLFGYHSYFANAPANMPFATLADYEQYLVSLADFPRYNREQIAALQAGVDSGFTQHCGALGGVEASIAELLVESPEQSSLYAPFVALPDAVPAAEHAR